MLFSSCISISILLFSRLFLLLVLILFLGLLLFTLFSLLFLFIIFYHVFNLLRVFGRLDVFIADLHIKVIQLFKGIEFINIVNVGDIMELGQLHLWFGRLLKTTFLLIRA